MTSGSRSEERRWSWAGGVATSSDELERASGRPQDVVDADKLERG